MNKRVFITKKFLPVCISLVLAFCLIFSSFSLYLVENLLNEEVAQTETTITNLEQGYVQHADFIKNTLIAEILDSEDENNNDKKQTSLFFVKVLNNLLLHYSIEKENIEAVQYAEHPIEKINGHKYIEYCSLKIPS